MSDSTIILEKSFRGEVPVRKQLDVHDVRLIGVPALIGVRLDVDALLKRLGEKALKSKGRRATAFYGALILTVREISE